MSNTEGSKSAPTKKPMTDAQKAALAKAQAASAAKRKAKTEVSSTSASAAQPDTRTPRTRPAESGAERRSPKADEADDRTAGTSRSEATSKGRKKSAPMVAARQPNGSQPATEVPAWVKSAEAGPPLSNAVETPAQPEGTKVRYPRTSARNAKARKDMRRAVSNGTPAAAGTLRAVGAAWLSSIEKGHTPLTVKTYARNLEVAYEYFMDLRPEAIDAAELERFNGSKAVTTKPNGKPRAKPTVLQIRRTLRMALEWAAKGLAG